jgi:hypothetical protein
MHLSTIPYVMMETLALLKIDAPREYVWDPIQLNALHLPTHAR